MKGVKRRFNNKQKQARGGVSAAAKFYTKIHRKP